MHENEDDDDERGNTKQKTGQEMKNIKENKDEQGDSEKEEYTKEVEDPRGCWVQVGVSIMKRNKSEYSLAKLKDDLRRKARNETVLAGVARSTLTPAPESPTPVIRASYLSFYHLHQDIRFTFYTRHPEKK